ncbi:hypothetical protein SprV_0401499500 [Sparganum proliferum]
MHNKEYRLESARYRQISVEACHKRSMSESSASGKQPKRVIHCSDGTITEYSDDDDAGGPIVEIQQQDSDALTWPSWLWKQANKASKMVSIVSDWMGEKCASLMGVTEPKNRKKRTWRTPTLSHPKKVSP